MKHIKFLGYEFDGNDNLIEHFEYLEMPYDWVHNGSDISKMDAVDFHNMMAKVIEDET